MEANFFLAQGIMVSVHLLISFINGMLVKHRGVRVNYTRKINHFFLFFLPIFINSIVSYNHTLMFTVIGMGVMIATLGIYSEPIRSRVRWIKIAFMSFDRPEDRPYTLLWLTTQVIAGTIVIIPLYIYFSSINMLQLIYIPILINGIGDGLAEPVGIRFGKHYYTTRALFTAKRYVRTLEGSACVFITSVVTMVLFREFFSDTQFLAALVIVPVLMTLFEAMAPHTWDTPFLYGASGLSIYGIFLI
jgi:phytol kinase